jgi:hypothetical protein
MPVIGELHDQGIRLGTHHVGGSVTHHAPLGLLGDKGHHGGQSPVTFGHPVVFQIRLLAAKGDGMEIEIEA